MISKECMMSLPILSIFVSGESFKFRRCDMFTKQLFINSATVVSTGTNLSFLFVVMLLKFLFSRALVCLVAENNNVFWASTNSPYFEIQCICFSIVILTLWPYDLILNGLLFTCKIFFAIGAFSFSNRRKQKTWIGRFSFFNFYWCHICVIFFFPHFCPS